MELFNALQSSCEADFGRPLFDFLEAARNGKRNGKIVPPYLPQCPLKPLDQLAKLALLWHEAGFVKEAGQLAAWLIPLKHYPSLWSTEKEYQPNACEQWFSHLSSIPPIAGWNPNFSYSLLHTAQMNGVFTLAGRGTSLGVLRFKEVEVRAFGPQSTALVFGINGLGLDSWVSTFAYPEVWLEARPEMNEKEMCLPLRFIGLTQETPLSFSFYVKAPLCQVGSETLKPKSLHRFLGEAQQVQLGSLLIESSQIHKVQVIPLAGGGCFWDCEFLVSFEAHPLAPQFSFILHSK